MNSMKVTRSLLWPLRLLVAGVNEDEDLANLHAAQALVADGTMHFCKQYLLIAA
jgi:hypothetical protein